MNNITYTTLYMYVNKYVVYHMYISYVTTQHNLLHNLLHTILHNLLHNLVEYCGISDLCFRHVGVRIHKMAVYMYVCCMCVFAYMFVCVCVCMCAFMCVCTRMST